MLCIYVCPSDFYSFTADFVAPPILIAPRGPHRFIDNVQPNEIHGVINSLSDSSSVTDSEV